MSTTFADHLPTGDHASRPAAGDVPEGTLYSCTDHDLIYQSDGASWSTWATVGGGGTDANAIHDNASGEIAAITEKASPVSADLILIEDSEASNAKKRVQVGNLPGGGSGGGEKGSLYAGMDNREYFNEVHGPDEGYDEEFDATNSTSLPSGWAWVNQGTATYIEHFGYGRIDWEGGGGDQNWHIVKQALDEPTFTVYAHVWYQRNGSGSSSDSYGPALIFRDSGTQEFVPWVVSWVGSGGSAGQSQLYVSKYTNPTTYGGSTFSGPHHTWPRAVVHWYYRVRKNSASDWDFAYSADGGCWFEFATGIDVSSWCDPDEVGFAVSGAPSCHMGFEWIRVRDLESSSS